MRCSRIREAVSARMDGENPGLPDGRVDAHLATCDACRAWAAAVSSLPATLADDPAVDAPDPSGTTPAPGVVAGLLAAASDAASRPAHRPALSGLRELRVVLAVLAVVQLAIAWPGVLSVGDAAAHMSHELTSWDFGLAVGFLFVAWQPSRAWGALPLAALLVTSLVAASVVDLASGHPLLGREVLHLLAIGGLGCQWLLARRVPRPAVVVRLA